MSIKRSCPIKGALQHLSPFEQIMYVFEILKVNGGLELAQLLENAKYPAVVVM